jgi:hypothetical protein
MLKLFIKRQRKMTAQAMIEFALVLPVLLLILYGVIEVARLAFIYSSVSMASRQAARYAAASGQINGVPFYENCDGIRNAANQSAFINTFDQINITYDRGVDSKGNQIPISGINPSPEVNSCPINYTMRNGDRIIVQVSSTYQPILPVLPIQPLEIASVSARTVLMSVSIVGSALPKAFAAESSTPSLTPPATSSANSPTVARTSPPTKPGHPHPGTTPTRFIPPFYTPTYGGPTVPVSTVVAFTPSSTLIPSETPTRASTEVKCTAGITHGKLVISNNTMNMDINNNTGYTLTAAQVYVEWNNNTGHKSRTDPTLRLRQILFANQNWSGDLQVPSTFIPGFKPLIPQGASTIQFVFHQTYDVTNGTERIIIYLATPGCINYLIDSAN